MKNAEILYQESAAQGDAVAQSNLGMLYYDGYGVSQDYARAVEWYTKAADQGNASALSNLGMMHMEGCGVSQDYKRAVEWFTQTKGTLVRSPTWA